MGGRKTEQAQGSQALLKCISYWNLYAVAMHYRYMKARFQPGYSSLLEDARAGGATDNAPLHDPLDSEPDCLVQIVTTVSMSIAAAVGKSVGSSVAGSLSHSLASSPLPLISQVCRCPCLCLCWCLCPSDFTLSAQGIQRPWLYAPRYDYQA